MSPGLFTKEEFKERVLAKRTEGLHIPADYGLAVLVAANAHLSQVCKSNVAYINHLLTVASNTKTDSEAKAMIAILHDLFEDTSWEPQDLRDLGFSERIILGIQGVTKILGEPYFDAIERCGLNPDSLDVKLADNEHNSSANRNDFTLAPADLERYNKYIVARQYLISIKKGDMHPGTPLHFWLQQHDDDLNNPQSVAALEKHSTKYQEYTARKQPAENL